MVKISRSHGLANGIYITGSRELFDFDSLAKAFKLFTDVPGLVERPNLQVVFVAPLGRVVRLNPLVVTPEQAAVITAPPRAKLRRALSACTALSFGR